MSCGNPHDVPCEEVLAMVYDYLDNECGDAQKHRILEHLDECGPCLRQFGLEQAVKTLIQRSCACQQAPDHLRVEIVTRIRSVAVSYRIRGVSD
jgi:mycothiol system anti-sigma-R factor